MEKYTNTGIFIILIKREQIQENINKEIYKVEVDQDDLNSYNEDLSNYFHSSPAKVIPLVSFLNKGGNSLNTH